MKRFILLPCMVILFGCGMDSYRPLVKQPQDAKYEIDLKECIQYSKDVRSSPNAKSVVIGATGLVGYAVMNEMKDKDDTFFKDGKELTNECLEKKGYSILGEG